MDATHLDLNSTGTLNSFQIAKLQTALQALAEDKDFSGISFYLNSDFIGGRPNDRG